MSKKTQQEKPTVLTLTIHDLNSLGCGVGRAEAGEDAGTVVFVKGAVTGDVVRAQIIKCAKSLPISSTAC